ncbi:MAG: hypothetical protein JJD97_05760 [Gemmatimonadaceae bacterium]|nr:hypothetical protein [Gemmatimonadaceae bacterium]
MEQAHENAQLDVTVNTAIPPLDATPPAASPSELESTRAIPAELVSAHELAANMIARAGGIRNTEGGVAAAAAVIATERTYRQLARSLGRIGSHAIFSRALALTQAEFSVLRQIHFERDADHVLRGVVDVTSHHGINAVSEALESMLETAFVLLGRLLGPDMVSRLMDRSTTIDAPEHEDPT